MPRLFRPHIPLEVRCRVAMRQMHYDDESTKIALALNVGQYGAFLAMLLKALAYQEDCKVEDLRLDHDPALATRRRRGTGKATVYDPPANDPDHLNYREAHAHHIKTNVRGDGAQHPDCVLIKRERKRQKPPERCVRCRTNYRKHAKLCGRCYRVALKHNAKMRRQREHVSEKFRRKIQAGAFARPGSRKFQQRRTT